ncbi:MAG: sporulation protein YabP [Clostridium sp.]
MDEKLSRRPHRLEISDREQGRITGIQDVVSFDENQIILDTDMGLLTIKGKTLHVSRLTLEKGEVDIEGIFDSMIYSSNENYRKSGESLFSRLFR